MIYDDGTKRWLPAGSGAQGFSKVHVYAHDANNTFRVVGRKMQDHEVRLNADACRGMAKLTGLVVESLSTVR